MQESQPLHLTRRRRNQAIFGDRQRYINQLEGFIARRDTLFELYRNKFGLNFDELISKQQEKFEQEIEQIPVYVKKNIIKMIEDDIYYISEEIKYQYELANLKKPTDAQNLEKEATREKIEELEEILHRLFDDLKKPEFKDYLNENQKQLLDTVEDELLTDSIGSINL